MPYMVCHAPIPMTAKICKDSNYKFNSVEHEILNAHKYKNIKKFGLFKAQLSLECYFFPLIHVQMPKIVGILTYMSGKNFMLN